MLGRGWGQIQTPTPLRMQILSLARKAQVVDTPALALQPTRPAMVRRRHARQFRLQPRVSTSA